MHRKHFFVPATGAPAGDYELYLLGSRPGLELVLFSPHLEAHEGIGGVAITSAQRAANYELRRAFIAPHLRG